MLIVLHDTSRRGLQLKAKGRVAPCRLDGGKTVLPIFRIQLNPPFDLIKLYWPYP